MKRAWQRVRNSQTLWRFALVGAFGTLLDFSLLFILQHIGIWLILANILSTGISFCYSFVANRRYTFRARGGNLRRQMISFTVVTLSGLWILQSGIIALLHPLFSGLASHELALLAAKLAATGASMVWNYVWYRQYVFREREAVDVK